MAYIQDISVLMRELLKVPKDYTPTALEISKYIKSRYSNNEPGSVPMGARAYSSGAQGPVSGPKASTLKEPRPPMTIQGPPIQKQSRLSAKQRITGRDFSFSTPRPEQLKGKLPKLTQEAPKFGMHKDSTKVTESKRSFSQRRYDLPVMKTAKQTKKPVTAPANAPGATQPPPAPRQHHTWNWQTAKNTIRRAVSEMVVSPSSTPKSKLSILAEQHKMDPNAEIAIESKKKEMLKKMVDLGSSERGEPLRTREIIQRLLEDNKLEVQRREIAKLTELARSRLKDSRNNAMFGPRSDKNRDAYHVQ